MSADTDFFETAGRLRRDFDASFALAPASAPERDDLLLVRVAGDHFAIRVCDITALIAKPKIVAVPATATALLGLSGIRGQLVPVFALPSLLGYSDSDDAPAWLLLCDREQPLGLAFSGFEGHLRLLDRQRQLRPDASTAHAFVSEIAETDSGLRHIIDLPRVLAAIRKSNPIAIQQEP
jgi:chemotaxis signal transduction protein